MTKGQNFAREDDLDVAKYNSTLWVGSHGVRTLSHDEERFGVG